MNSFRVIFLQKARKVQQRALVVLFHVEVLEKVVQKHRIAHFFLGELLVCDEFNVIWWAVYLAEWQKKAWKALAAEENAVPNVVLLVEAEYLFRQLG